MMRFGSAHGSGDLTAREADIVQHPVIEHHQLLLGFPKCTPVVVCGNAFPCRVTCLADNRKEPIADWGDVDLGRQHRRGRIFLCAHSHHSLIVVNDERRTKHVRTSPLSPG